ncbi:SET and MYND domain-containing protein 4-like isoform X1 [Artemia franciscana]|uniref:SET and MYND domain-containing protein 4-like isoform X1 n=1 Tax=Artemia franciscana TaxID=6661 RepID=UPI0032D9D17A
MATFHEDFDDFNTNSKEWQKYGGGCISSLYNNLGSDAETFVQCKDNKEQYTRFLQCHDAWYPVPELSFQEKSLEEAEQYKSIGNSYFAKGAYEDALGLYKQSILNAPKKSETLAISYANRSAVFFKLEKFEYALLDIEAAIKEDYPEDKLDKLLLRKEMCLKVISARKPIKKSFDKYEDPKVTRANLMCPALSDKVQVQVSEKAGRYLIAKEDIPVGEIILVEEPFVLVQIRSLYRITCHYCSSLIERAVPCDLCAKIAFCSENCKNSATFHSYECQLLDLLFDSGLGKDAFIGLRLMTRYSPDRVMNALKDGVYSAILEAEYHPEFKERTEEARIVITSKFLTDVLKKVNFLKDNDEIHVAPLIMQFLRSIRFNKLTVDKFLSHDPEEEMYDVAVGMYNTFNLINHSCDPNVFNYFLRNNVILVAKRPIKAGDEVAFCYGPRYPAVPKDERRKELQRDFQFFCECAVCTKDPDVKIVQNLNLKSFTQRRLFCCPSCYKLGLRIKQDSRTSICKECNNSINPKALLHQCQNLIKKIEGVNTRIGDVFDFKDVPVLLSLVKDFGDVAGWPSEYGLKAEEIVMYLIRRLGSSQEISASDIN